MNDRMMREAGAVIHRRLEIMAEAVCDPAGADLTELALMSDEKVAAFHAVSDRATAGAGIVAGRVARALAVETDAASHAMEQVMRASDPAQAAVIQTQWALGCWTRATERALTLNADWARMQTYVLAPLHTAVSANARRLKIKEKT
ncbi:MAG: phasin [Brevundimonas sp.]|nr:phasin [Brevundimonas sp.]